MRPLNEIQCQCGEIGRHAGFKIRFLQGSGGSTPPTGTIILKPRIFNDIRGFFMPELK
jgi:hypothetical protein